MNPSTWVLRFAAQLPPASRVLDLACGSGRHAKALITRGHKVTAVDKDGAALANLPVVAERVPADLETRPWPLAGRTFDLVLVTHYLWRPLLPHILASVAPGGWLIYETFAAGNETIGRPSNPDFLLRPGELLDLVAGTLRVVAYEDGYLDAPPRYIQRIAAVRPPAVASADSVPRHAL